MKITICGSIAFYDEMCNIQKNLEKNGHQVKSPEIKVKDENTELSTGKLSLDRRGNLMKNHFSKVEWSDAILVLNYDNNNILNRVGINTLLEMGLAFYLDKKIFLLKDVPELDCKEEILVMKPIVINENLSLIK